MINTADYHWYQADILKKDGERVYWKRFIATTPEDAQERINQRLKKELTGSLKNEFYQLLAKRYIDNFDIYRVPDAILQEYDMNNSEDYEAFLDRKRG